MATGKRIIAAAFALALFVFAGCGEGEAELSREGGTAAKTAEAVTSEYAAKREPLVKRNRELIEALAALELEERDAQGGETPPLQVKGGETQNKRAALEAERAEVMKAMRELNDAEQREICAAEKRRISEIRRGNK